MVSSVWPNHQKFVQSNPMSKKQDTKEEFEDPPAKKSKSVIPSETLPTEILHNIFSFTPKEIKTFRLVNKEYNMDIAKVLKFDKTALFKFEKVSKSILDFVKENVTRLELTNARDLNDDDFQMFVNLEHLILQTEEPNYHVTDDGIKKLQSIKHLEIHGSWPKISGNTLHLLPDLTHLTLLSYGNQVSKSVEWDELHLSSLVSNSINAPAKAIAALTTLEKLKILVKRTKYMYETLPSLESCSRLSHIVMSGLPHLWINSLTPLLKNNGKNIKEFKFYVDRVDFEGDVGTGEYDTIMFDADEKIREHLKYMPNLEILKFKPLLNKSYDFSYLNRLQHIELEDNATKKNILTIPMTCKFVSLTMKMGMEADVIARFRHAETLFFYCTVARPTDYAEQWEKVETTQFDFMRCKKLFLWGVSATCADEILANSPYIEHLSMKYHSSKSHQKNPWKGGLERWYENLLNLHALKELYLDGVPFDCTLLEAMSSLKSLHFDPREKTTNYPTISALRACKKLNDLTLYMGYNLIDNPLSVGLNLDFTQIRNDDFTQLQYLTLGTGATEYARILPRCVNLISFTLEDEMPDIKDSWFKELRYLEETNISGPNRMTGEFLQYTPRLKHLSIAKCRHFDIENLTKNAKTLTNLTSINIIGPKNFEKLTPENYLDYDVVQRAYDSFPDAVFRLNLKNLTKESE